jgi:hypothetical protein
VEIYLTQTMVISIRKNKSMLTYHDTLECFLYYSKKFWMFACIRLQTQFSSSRLFLFCIFYKVAAYNSLYYLLPFHGKQLTVSFVSFCAMYTWIFCCGLELNNYYRNIILSKYTQRLQTTAKNIFFKSYSWLFYYVYLLGLPNVQGLLATLIRFVANKH